MKRHAMNFKDLLIYQKSSDLAFEIFEFAKSFPGDEMLSLTAPVRKAARSIGAQIAVAWSQRMYEAYFVEHLVQADAKLKETMHWVSVARRCSYLSPEESEGLNEQFSEIERMLYSMIEQSSDFCDFDNTVRESRAEYGSDVSGESRCFSALINKSYCSLFTVH